MSFSCEVPQEGALLAFLFYLVPSKELFEFPSVFVNPFHVAFVGRLRVVVSPTLMAPLNVIGLLIIHQAYPRLDNSSAYILANGVIHKV